MKHIYSKTAVIAAICVMAGAAFPGDSLARTALANGQTDKKIFSQVLPDSIYQLDDGISEGSTGIWIAAYGYDICLNQYPVIPGSETITSVSINWGWPGLPQFELDGIPYTIGIWSDPNGDGQPDDAVLLTTATDVIANSGTDTFVTTQVTPTTITTPDFFVGFVVYNGPPYYPCSVDESNPQPARSFYAAGIDTYDFSNLTDNPVPVESIADFGFAYNFMIRADSGSSSGLVLTGGSSELNGWNLSLPANGTGIEDRSGGSTGVYRIYLTFNNPLSTVKGASTSCGTVSSVKIDPDNAKQVEVDLTGMSCSASKITITATGLKSTSGQKLSSASLTFGLLIGDVNGDGVVDNKDTKLVRGQMGQPVRANNYRFKVSADLSTNIDKADANMVTNARGSRLP